MKLENIIVFMGAPGSGKGTQTELLAKKSGYEYFSTGALSREYATHKDDFGHKIKSIIDQGFILPIDIITEIFTKKFETLVDKPGVILDGYPRTIEQAQLLENIMERYEIRNLQALFLEVDKKKLKDRILKRGSVAGRADDDPAVVEKRFDQYMLKTAPVKDYYEQKGFLIHINGDQPIEAVHQEILKKLGIK